MTPSSQAAQSSQATPSSGATQPRHLRVEADGGSRGNPGPAGYGAVVRDGVSGAVLAERAGFLGVATNNVAEYNGLIAGLEAALALDPQASIAVHMDSKLVVEQMSGRWKVKHPDMKPLATRAHELIRNAEVTFTWIPRERNKAADALANEAMDSRKPVIARDHGPQAAQAGAADAPVEAGNDTTAPRPPRNLSAMGGQEFLDPLTVVLVRHGVTDMTIESRLSGSGVAGPALNAAGRIQAAQAADALYRIGRDRWTALPTASHLLASPMVRTQETAAAIGRRLGLNIETDERVREVDFGAWEGLTAEQAVERDGEAILRWQAGEHAAPDGESIADVAARMRDFLASLAARHAAGKGTARTVVVVSHAVAIKAGIGGLLGLAPAAAARLWPLPASYSIVQLRVTPDGVLADAHVLCMGVPTD